jgi:hypothetical protein
MTVALRLGGWINHALAGREVGMGVLDAHIPGEGRRGPRGEAVPLTATAQVPSYLSRAGVE